MNAQNSNAQANSKVPDNETKNQKFIRLMTTRLGRVLEDMRLIGQLSAKTYEHTNAEVEEVVRYLDTGVKDIARVFGVAYVSKIGRASLATKATTAVVQLNAPKVSGVSENSQAKIVIAKALDLMSKDQVRQAETLLRDFL